MGLFKLDPKESLEHDLRKIDKQFIPKILETIENLSENPFPVQSRNLTSANMAEKTKSPNLSGFFSARNVISSQHPAIFWKQTYR